MDSPKTSDINKDIPGLEHEIPIFFAIANKTNRVALAAKYNKNAAQTPPVATIIPPMQDDIQKQENWLPQLLPKEGEDEIQKESLPASAKPPAVAAAPKVAPPTQKAQVEVKATNTPQPSQGPDPLKPFRTAKTKVAVNTLLADNQLNWLPKMDVNEYGEDDITLVTAYINLGRYRNDDTKLTYSPDLFKSWMTAFCRIENPVVVFMNDEKDLSLFGNIRTHVPNHKTFMYKVSKNDLWSFSLLPNITKIYQGWPKHSPLTTSPQYTCTSHAKYEFLASAMRENPFKTKFFAWIDIGYFRDMAKPIVEPGPTFSLYLPPMLDQGKIAYSEVQPRTGDQNPSDILKFRKPWISSAMLVGKTTTMKRWVIQYMKYVNKFLEGGLSGADQYLIHAMFQSGEEMDVEIQTYSSEGFPDPGHHLGFLCKDEGNRKRRFQGGK